MKMNFNKYGLYPLNYTIVFCTSADPNFPIENINKKSRFPEMIPINNTNQISKNNNKDNNTLNDLYFNCGWSSLRYCSYPQMIITQLSSMSDIKKIEIEINHERIPQKIDVYVYCPTIFKEVVTNLKNILSAEFTYIGSVIPINHNKNQREIKTLIFHQNDNYNPIIIKNCLYVKFVVHKNYENKTRNKFNQVGIINIDIYGITSGKILPVLPLQKEEKFKNDEILPRLKGLYTDNDYDNYIKEKIEKAKYEYYMNKAIMNNEVKRNKIYEEIQILRELGKKVLELNKEKEKFTYFQNDRKIRQIDLKLNEIKKYIQDTYPYYGKEKIFYDNDVEYDETQNYEIKSFENHLEQPQIETNNNVISDNNNINDNNNDVNINDENIEEDDIVPVDDGNDVELTQKKNYMLDMNNNVVLSNQISEKSKEILRRHQEKQKMIKENKDIAEHNRQIENAAFYNRNNSG